MCAVVCHACVFTHSPVQCLFSCEKKDKITSSWPQSLAGCPQGGCLNIRSLAMVPGRCIEGGSCCVSCMLFSSKRISKRKKNTSEGREEDGRIVCGLCCHTHTFTLTLTLAVLPGEIHLGSVQLAFLLYVINFAP